MPVTVAVREVGTFTKLADKTTIPGDLPRRLNTRADLYGRLAEPLDLSLGFEDYKDEGMGDKFQSLFDYLKKTSKPGTSLEEVVSADFVSNRRNLHIFARSPYEKNKKMQEIQAIKKNGVIFLCDKAEDVEDTSLPYGYKFEQYMTLSEEGYTRNKYEKVSNATCSKALFRTSIDSGKETIKVLYAAEIDAIDRAENFVELKTTFNNYHKWLQYNSLSEYLQSYLGNIKYIIRGTKVWNEPKVYRTDRVWTHDIPKMPVTWNKDTCFEALFGVLQKIKSKLEYDDEALVVRIERGEEITFEPECSKNCTFLKPEYFAHFE
ncbi:unnamed protein product [Caenorhabditis brenneri]